MTYPKAIYHTEGDPHPAAIVESAEQERAQRIGWGQSVEAKEEIDTVESLRAKLDAAGKTYDKRWGVDKLRAAL